MSNFIAKVLMAVLGLGLLSACHKHSKSVKTTPTQTVVHKKDSCKINFKYNNLIFNYFSAKGKISYQDQNNSYNANFNLRIKKDSIIWVSVSLFGVEGARFIITKDSIFGVNKMSKEYYIYSIDHFSKQFNVDLTYKTFESILVGNMPIEPHCTDTLLFQGNYEILKRDTIDNNFEAYINGQNLRLEKFTVVQKPLSNTLNVNYSDFQSVVNLFMAHKADVSIKYFTPDNRVVYNSVFLEYNKIDIDEKELKFPFSIPNRFK